MNYIATNIKIPEEDYLRLKAEAARLKKSLPDLIGEKIGIKKRKSYKSKKIGLNPTPYLQRILKKAEEDRSHDSPTFDNAKDAIVYLHERTK